VGEDGVIELLRNRFTAAAGVVGIGDDAAVFPSPGEHLVLTTDTLVEGVDFHLGYFSGADLGWKAVAVNVSDLAAMGAEPAYAVATLCLPSATSVGWVTSLIDGIEEAAQRWSVRVVGGDLSRATQISLGLSLMGHCSQPVLRSGARTGDAIMVSGELGGSAGGLRQLQRDPSATGPLVDRHRRPQARMELSRAAPDLGVTSMIDLSDGLVVDLRRLMRASGTGCDVDPGSVPVDRNLDGVADIDPLQAALFGGEDFELLFTLAPERVTEAVDAGERIGVAVTRIGTVTGSGQRLGGTALEDLEDEGWDHLRNR
jgi:thiamine-monophosphate kinase